MPKKFASENTKAVQARERKKATKEAEVSRKEQKETEESWKDDDKLVKKKQQRKEEQDKKREQQLAKKAESKALLEQEMSSIKAGKPNPPAKVTRAQISVNAAKKPETAKEKVATHLDQPLLENINRLEIEGDEARTVEEAIGILGTKTDDQDKHPEKRMKALFTAYEARRLNELKLEHPSLRLSQLKQMIFKEWQKAPENPINQ